MLRKSEEEFTLYKISNDVNEKLYIGVTNKSITLRMSGHRSAMRQGNPNPLYQAMRELGAEHFSIEQIEVFQGDRCIAEGKEAGYILTLGSAYPQGYNLRKRLTNEQVALIRYDFYGWPRSKYVQKFNITNANITSIRARSGDQWLNYTHVTRDYLPVQEQVSKSAKKLPKWGTIQEAAGILSENAGRTIASSYVRILARNNHIEARALDGRTNWYNLDQCRAYKVKQKEGTPPKGDSQVDESIRWVKSPEAADILSRTNGRSISTDYVRILAGKGIIRSKANEVDKPAKLYAAEDCERKIYGRCERRVTVRVRDQRSGKPGGRPRKTATSKESQ